MPLAWENAVLGTGQFQGVHFDIEPQQLADWGTNQAADALAYVNALIAIRANNTTVHMEADIGFYYGEISVNGYPSLADAVIATTDEITIMSYRNTAGVAGGNGMYSIGIDELTRSSRAGKLARLGAETNNVQPPNITFYGVPSGSIDRVMNQVDQLSSGYPAYNGIAVEDYFGWNNFRN